MIEKRFHFDLYDGNAIDKAVKVYEAYGSFELEKSSEAFIVRVTAKGGINENMLADELGNYALGTTIETRQPATGGGAA